jgi:S1-C subfamily serine protease
VEKGSPADRAGLRDGDVIVRYRDSAIASVDDLHRLLTEEQLGVSATITAIRLTEKIEAEIVPARAAGD